MRRFKLIASAAVATALVIIACKKEQSLTTNPSTPGFNAGHNHQVDSSHYHTSDSSYHPPVDSSHYHTGDSSQYHH